MELKEILETMDIPEQRKEDLLWLKRNLAIRNRDNPNFKAAIKIIDSKLSEWLKS